MEISELIASLSSLSAQERQAAAEALCRLGEQGRPAAVPLVRVAGDDVEAVREWAAAALEELGPPAAEDAPALAALLADRREDVAYWAATLLGRLEADAAVSTEQLATALADSPHMAVRQRAAWALGRIGPPAQAARPPLATAAASPDARLARLASEALVRLEGN